MRAVIVTVLALYHSLMGNCKARSYLLATITEAMLREEEDVTTSSCFKKTAPRFRRHLLRFVKGIITQRVSFLSLPSLSHISLSLLPPISDVAGLAWPESPGLGLGLTKPRPGLSSIFVLILVLR